MKTIRVAINGFGRIGKATFKVLSQKENVKVVAINDLVDVETVAYLLKYDSIHKYPYSDISYNKTQLRYNGNEISVFNKRNISELPWKELDIDVVIEATGAFKTREEIEKHIEVGAKKVILTAPPKDDIKMFVLGINDDELTKDYKIISNASCTTNCLTPMIKVMEKIGGTIQSGMVSTIHSYTIDQRLIDSPHSAPRRGRAAAANIIPTTTGAAKASVKIFPHLKGKLEAMAYRVPVLNGSITELTCTTQNKLTIEQINQEFKDASETYLKGILQYTQDEIVSSDIIGNPYSTIFDAKLTKVSGDIVRILGWYDNEIGYSNRLADMVIKFVGLS